MRELDELEDHVDEDHFPAAAILLVDDHRPNLLTLQVMLEPLGHELVMAESAYEAIQKAAAREFAVIVTDVEMPGLDGFDLVKRLRATTRTPVVMMSGVYDDRDTVRRAYSLGAVDFVGKPFDADLVRWRIAALVSLYRRGEELKLRARLIAKKEREAAAAQAATAVAVAQVEEVKRRLQEKDQVVGILGHDLRNPLSTVLLSFASLKRKPESPGARAHAERGEKAAERMKTMVQDILDFARASPGATFPIRPRSADLKAIALMVVDEVKAASPERAIDLETRGDLTVVCDPDRIAQVIGNLVVNAVQHGVGTISVGVGAGAAGVVLSVHNDGEPIAADDLPTLFEPFKKARNGSHGLGLGLHIVREIVRAHGGAVAVRSTREAGTIFEASWPLQVATSTEPSPGSRRSI